MNSMTKLNTNNFQKIIILNEHLITLKNLDDLFEYLCSYLKKDLNIKKLSLNIKELIYKNFTDSENLEEKKFKLNLNKHNSFSITLFFKEYEKNDITSSFEYINTIFKVISQTIYNKYLESKLVDSTIKDSVTGLYNRQYVDEYLDSILPLSTREEKKVAFLKVGIDHFKAVIDEFDYSTGDKVLKELAKILENSIRKSDIVARIDSDEFLIVLHNISNENNAIIIAEKIINNFKNVKVVVNEETNQTLMKTICTGISIYPDDAQEAEEIFRSSDIALYEAKNKGRSQFFKFKKEENVIELF